MTKIDNKATFEQGWLSLVLKEENGHEFVSKRGEFLDVTHFALSKVTRGTRFANHFKRKRGQWVL